MRSLTFILFFCLFAAAVQARMLSVTGGKVNLRTGPGNKYAVRWGVWPRVSGAGAETQG
jgi:hypothetical protein